MSSAKMPSVLVIGLALFSMFFGSGNLIFPLYMGQLAGTQWTWATAGFLLTATLLPFVGVIAMVAFRGNYQSFFSILGQGTGRLFTLLLLTVWIPLGSGPRCIALSYASLQTFFAVPSLWIFGLVYSVVVYVVVRNRQRMIQILGRWLTPSLLICLAAIIGVGLIGHVPASTGWSSSDLFVRGLLEGYNTMDLIAAFFFAASIIQVYCKSDADPRSRLRLILKASAVGVFLLGAVYVGLVYLAASHGPALAGIPKEQLLAAIAKMTLGSEFGVVAAVAISLACLTTSVALTSVYADFISQAYCKVDRRLPSAVIGTLVSFFVMSLFGLSGITAVTAPALQVCYPILICLVLLHGLLGLLRQRQCCASAVE